MCMTKPLSVKCGINLWLHFLWLVHYTVSPDIQTIIKEILPHVL